MLKFPVFLRSCFDNSASVSLSGVYVDDGSKKLSISTGGWIVAVMVQLRFLFGIACLSRSVACKGFEGEGCWGAVTNHGHDG